MQFPFDRIPTSTAADYILEGDKLRGQKQTCTITRRKEEGNVIHMVAKCADDIMTSNVQFSAKVIDENTIARIFPEMPKCRSLP